MNVYYALLAVLQEANGIGRATSTLRLASTSASIQSSIVIPSLYDSYLKRSHVTVESCGDYVGILQIYMPEQTGESGFVSELVIVNWRLGLVVQVSFLAIRDNEYFSWFSSSPGLQRTESTRSVSLTAFI